MVRAPSPTRAAIQAVASGLASALAACQALLEVRDPAEWVDQHHSPLGRRRHCRLVREGKLPGSKVEGHVYVRRADLDAFLEKHAVVPRAPAVTAEEREKAEVESVLRRALERPRKRKRARET